MNLAEFRRTLRLEGMPAIEEKWLVLLEAPEIDVPFALDVVDLLLGEEHKKPASDLLEMLVTEVLKREKHEQALTILKHVARVFPTNKQVRERLVTCFRTLYGKEYDLDRLIEETGLEGREPLREALKRMDLYLSFKPGDPVQHRSWGVGLVKEVDIHASVVVVDFANRRAHRFDLTLASGVLVRIPQDGFRARLATDPEGTRALAQNDPVALVKLVLRDAPEGLNSRELKKLLDGAAIAADSWARWWPGARKALLGDPFIQMSRETTPSIKLRTEAFEPARHALALARSGLEFARKVADVHGLLERVTESPETIQTLGELAAALKEEHDRQPEQSSARFSLCQLVDAISKRCPSVQAQAPSAPLPANPEELIRWLGEIPVKEHRAALLASCREARVAHWPDYLRRLILTGPDESRDSAVDELNRLAPDALEVVIYEVFSGAEDYFEAFLLLARLVMIGRVKCPEAYALTDVFRILATSTNRLRSGVVRVSGDATATFKSARGLLVDQKLVRRVMEATPQPEIQRVISQMASLRRLDDRPARVLESVVHDLYPEFFQPAVERDKINDNVILTTNEGLAAIRRDFDHIMQEELPKIAHELGHAISLGDVSDSAEFRSARQRQQDLVHRASKMRQDIARANVVAPDAVRVDRVGFGVQVEVTDLAANQRATYQILGPWEADLTHNIISYLSPLGRGFWGKSAGEETAVQLPEQTLKFRIESIALAPRMKEGQ